MIRALSLIKKQSHPGLARKLIDVIEEKSILKITRHVPENSREDTLYNAFIIQSYATNKP